MGGNMRFSACGIALLSVTSMAAPSALAQNEGPTETVITRALSALSQPADIFRIEGDAAVHVQSGLQCPAYVGNAFLANILEFDTPAGRGMHVGCDYARRAEPGSSRLAAKHTIFAVKLAEGETLDSVFARYQAEMYASTPGQMRSNGESLIMDDAPDEFPEVRSEELFYGAGDQVWKTELIVTLYDDWIIQVRSTRSEWNGEDGEIREDQKVGVMLFSQTINVLGGLGIDFHYVVPLPSEPTDNL